MRKLTNKQIYEISTNHKVRLWVTKEDFELFFKLYFSENMTHNLASFHHDMMELASNNKIWLVNILAFRWSWKTTILNQAFPIWSVLWKNNKKFVLVVSKTINQAKLFLENIKLELENNELLKNDYFIDKTNVKFRKTQINIFDSVIKIACIKTTLRWMKRWYLRPDLIICDDLEDSSFIWNEYMEDKLYYWFKKEIIPLVWDNSKIVLLGNYLWKDCLLNRIHKEITQKKISWISKFYPICDRNWNILWNDKYNREDILKLEDNIWNELTWYNEYMLTWIPNKLNNLKIENFSYFEDEIPRDYEWKKWGWIYIDYKNGSYDNHNSFLAKLAVFWTNHNAKIYLYPDYVYGDLNKENIVQFFNKIKSDFIIKRKRIYCNENKTDKVLLEWLLEIWEQYWYLIKEKERDWRTSTKEKWVLSYDDKFCNLLDLIKEKRIIFFNKWLDFIINEILEYWSNWEISDFMISFLDFIQNIIDLSFCSYDLTFPTLPPSQFYLDPVSDEEWEYEIH